MPRCNHDGLFYVCSRGGAFGGVLCLDHLFIGERLTGFARFLGEGSLRRSPWVQVPRAGEPGCDPARPTDCGSEERCIAACPEDAIHMRWVHVKGNEQFGV